MIRRPASVADLDAACALVEKGVRAYYEAAVGPWNAEDARTSIARTLPGWEILERGGAVVGALHVEDADGDVWLRQIYLAETNTGLGGRLVAEGVAAAHARGRSVRLRLIRGNPAQRLYARQGFVVEREEPARVYMVAHPDVEALSAAQLRAYNATDLEAFCACYHTEVCVLGEDGAPRLSGMEAFRASYRKMFAENEGVGAEVDTRLTLGPHTVERERWWRTNRATGLRSEGVVLVRYTAVDGRIRWVEFLR